MQEYCIGIDFGTTNTAVVCIQDDKLGRRTRLLGENGEYPFSSIAAIPKSGGVLKFGRNVREKRLELSDTHQVFTSMKSYLGTKHEFIVGEHRYSATDITAEFLKYVKQSVLDTHKIEISEAAFSFPVDFSPEARRDLYEAAELAGIQVKSFVSESTAAYLANRKECSAFSKVMVLDWGGGTLDISILGLKGSEVHELSVSGYRVGGDDIDRELANRMHSRIAAKSGITDGVGFGNMQPQEQDQMIMRCEEAKISISDYEEDEEEYHPLTVRNYGAYGTKTENLSPEQFNAIVEPIIRNRVLSTIEDALKKAGLGRASIDAVIVVGGSSNLRVYENAIQNLFKDAKIIFPKKRQWSTAEGAALLQLTGGEFRLNDDLGVLLSDDSVFPIFKKDKDGVGSKPIPTTFSLTEDVRDAHFIFTDGSGKHTFQTINVPTKGFLNEKLTLSAEIGEDQIARITINNPSMGKQRIQCEINQLTFHYDISALDNV
ncbi:hypothetical protein FACS1894216_15370 [Synergistales bacterium]|nr:hypothetical protein FACS1894216_15370 [Synergistales bacterium]